MLWVVADDITGAAEMAGIALRFGCRVGLSVYTEDDACITPPSAEVDVQVYATDTRSMSEAEAIALTAQLGRQLKAAGCTNLFKKTDSALRGHIVPELKTLLKTTGIPHALLLPQNPSLGRILHGGIYSIKGTPLHKTPFASDPEYPATTSRAATLLKLTEEDANLIRLPDATTTEEVSACLHQTNDGQTLFAGAADLFTAWLYRQGYHPLASPTPFAGLGDNSALILCGSTARHPLANEPYLCRSHTPLRNMPLAVYQDQASAEAWLAELLPLYEAHPSLALVIDHPPLTDKAIALRLRTV
ncbi:MAG: four-carbon acid sugar kinase family protein, partial [Mediterranea sp.]|nr:four-carbon acid sugar kinase family protein [Mediterranea sp.]